MGDLTPENIESAAKQAFGSDVKVQIRDTASTTIYVDTREQRPFPFPKGVVTESFLLREGDYSTPPLLNVARVERKSLPDLISSLTRDRERFDREVERLKKYPHRLAIVEGDLGDLYSGRVPCGMHPHALIGSIASLYARHGLPVLFAHSPEVAGRLVAGIFRRLEEQIRPQPEKRQ